MFLDYRSILSGRRTDPLAILMRGVLRAASIPYGSVVARRNRRYDSGVSEIHRCGVPVISVGNLTTGGTGKTPIVCFLAQWLRDRGIRVAIVSRGYGRQAGEVNDEALELHWRLPDVPHVQDADRVEAARVAVEELAAEMIIMDDGFQHRRLHRDLDLVVIDATCPFGYDHLLPRGLLREPVNSLRRADAVIVTRCDAASDSQLAHIEGTVHEIHPAAPIMHSEHRPSYLLEHPDQRLPISRIDGRRVGAVSAIGNPEGFEQTVRHCGAMVVDSQQLADHDPYEPETVGRLSRWAAALGDQVDGIVCTHKDLVKLRTDRLGGKPLWAILIELKFRGDTRPLESALDGLLD